MKQKLRALEQKLWRRYSPTQPVFIIFHKAGYAAPEECVKVLQERAIQENPHARFYEIVPTDRHGRCFACGQIHLDEQMRQQIGEERFRELLEQWRRSEEESA
ncbi:hypothetical protein [Thermoflexus sp.]|uniref:hypothetical protein n=1 Tax=Thermoflexus sp. TaxID=1969742 RepID=UPI0035E45A07